MKRFTLLKTMLLLCALIVGSVNGWAQSYEWVKTDLEDLSDGDVVVILETALYTRALINAEATSSGSVKATSSALTLNGDANKITSEVAANIQWVFNGNSTSFTLKSNDDAKRQLWCRDNNDALRVKSTSPASGYYGTFTWDDTYKMIKSTQYARYVGIWNNSGDYQWRAYSSQTANNIKGCQTSFFKKTDLADTRKTATWSVSPSSASVNQGSSVELELTTNYDGVLTFTSNDTETATVTYNSSTNIITINGVKVGSTTITATGEGTTKYKPISKTIIVTVNIVELPYNHHEAIDDLGYNFWDEITSSGSSADEINGRQNDISINVVKSSGVSPRADGNYFRFYKENIMTISAPIGGHLTKIVFTAQSDSEWKGTLDPDKGVYDNTSRTWYATTDNVNELTITGVDGTNRIQEMDIYMFAPPIPVTITAAGYATYVSDKDLDYSGVTGLKTYKAKVSGNSIAFTRVTTVPAGEGVLLRATSELAESTVFNIPVTTDVDAWAESDNDFIRGTGATVATQVGSNYNYILSTKGGVVGFYNANGNTVANNRAYLSTTTAPKNNSRLSTTFDDDETTGINAVENVEQTMKNAVIYNLNGQRVVNPIKGLYIVNGKKVIFNK